MLLSSDVRYKVSVLKSDFQKRNKKLIHFLNRICTVDVVAWQHSIV